MRNVAFFLTLLVIAHPCPVRADSVAGDMAYMRTDYATAFREWAAASASGDVSAMVGLGTLYDTGHGVPQDFVQALGWYRRAAEAGSVSAMFNVGAMYDNGRGTAVDRRAAIAWYSLAADRGHGRAAFALGLIYRSGDGVPRDRTEAIRFFQIAAGAGIGAATANLAQLRAPVPPARNAVTAAAPPPARVPAPRPVQEASSEVDRVQQAVLARAALDAQGGGTFAALVPRFTDEAASDSQLAQYNVGYAFEYGYGVTRDPVRSYVNYLRATASPNQNVRDAALRGAVAVGKALTDAQHTAARDMLLDGSH